MATDTTPTESKTVAGSAKAKTKGVKKPAAEAHHAAASHHAAAQHHHLAAAHALNEGKHVKAKKHAKAAAKHSETAKELADWVYDELYVVYAIREE